MTEEPVIFNIPWDEGEETKEICPECMEATLTQFAVGNGPDDYRIDLMCSFCGYHEQP